MIIFSPSECFPDTLPSYTSALDLKQNEHWMKKFFRDPPPSYHEALIIRQPTTTINNSLSDVPNAITTTVVTQTDDDEETQRSIPLLVEIDPNVHISTYSISSTSTGADIEDQSNRLTSIDDGSKQT
jgi:hypothetical protein